MLKIFTDQTDEFLAQGLTLVGTASHPVGNTDEVTFCMTTAVETVQEMLAVSRARYSKAWGMKMGSVAEKNGKLVVVPCVIAENGEAYDFHYARTFLRNHMAIVTCERQEGDKIVSYAYADWASFLRKAIVAINMMDSRRPDSQD